MRLSEAVRHMVETLDAAGLRLAWATLCPGERPPRSDAEALIVLHSSRAQMDGVPVTLRRRSHEWLMERGIPSLLPPDLIAQDGPVRVGVTGIAVKSSYPEIATSIHDAMHSAVLECLANGDNDAVTKGRMAEARHKERKALGLRPLVGG